MEPLTIHSRLGDYDVDFRDDADWAVSCLGWRTRSLLSTSSCGGCTARAAWRPSRRVHSTWWRPRKRPKTLDGIATLCDGMIAQAAKRNAVIVSVGGGVVQDATGFLASVIYRGVDWTYVPSTLLAQADSCIGAKTSLNFRHFKNLLGTMYPPKRVNITRRSWKRSTTTTSSVARRDRQDAHRRRT